MGEGRGSAFVVALVLLMVVGGAEVAQGATPFKVGGAKGWTFKVAGVPRGKTFKAGDTLVFNYTPRLHNVVVVNKDGYNSCKPSARAKVYGSGKDQIKLAKGLNYFICSLPGHCQSGMKIAINAL